jgi:hypothetical protein
MVETITPVVHGGLGRWSGAIAVHAAGAAAAAASFGAALAVVGDALGAPWGGAGFSAVAVAAGTYAGSEVSGGWAPVPALRRQVPDWWRTFFGRQVASGLYGAALGIGFFTFLAHGTLVAVSLAAVASGRPAVGALLLVPFGLARGISPLSARRVRTPEHGRALVGRLAGTPERRRRSANAAVLGAVATLAGARLALDPSDGTWWRLAAVAIAGVFAWAAASKFVAWRRWWRALDAHRLPARVVRVASWAVPLSEAFVALLVLVGLPRFAAAGAIVLLAGFSIEIARVSRLGGSRVPCGCFGGRGSIDSRLVLLRNAGLVVLAGVVLARGSDAPVIAWPGAPAAAEAFPAVLASIGLGAAIVTSWRSVLWLRAGRRA